MGPACRGPGLVEKSDVCLPPGLFFRGHSSDVSATSSCGRGSVARTIILVRFGSMSGGDVSGPGPGGLPPIRRRGVARPSPASGSGTRATGPGGGARGGATGWDDVAGPPGGGSRRGGSEAGWGGPAGGTVRLDRPNALLVAGLAVLALITVILVLRGALPHLGAAIVIGMFVGVVVLGLARLDANSKRSGGRFADWRIESVRVATLLFVVGWLAGLVSLWRFALVLSRNFT